LRTAGFALLSGVCVSEAPQEIARLEHFPEIHTIALLLDLVALRKP
jgi:hypothetical protein